MPSKVPLTSRLPVKIQTSGPLQSSNFGPQAHLARKTPTSTTTTTSTAAATAAPSIESSQYIRKFRLSKEVFPLNVHPTKSTTSITVSTTTKPTAPHTSTRITYTPTTTFYSNTAPSPSTPATTTTATTTTTSTANPTPSPLTQCRQIPSTPDAQEWDTTAKVNHCKTTLSTQVTPSLHPRISSQTPRFSKRVSTSETKSTNTAFSSSSSVPSGQRRVTSHPTLRLSSEFLRVRGDPRPRVTKPRPPHPRSRTLCCRVNLRSEHDDTPLSQRGDIAGYGVSYIATQQLATKTPVSNTNTTTTTPSTPSTTCPSSTTSDVGLSTNTVTNIHHTTSNNLYPSILYQTDLTTPTITSPTSTYPTTTPTTTTPAAIHRSIPTTPDTVSPIITYPTHHTTPTTTLHRSKYPTDSPTTHTAIHHSTPTTPYSHLSDHHPSSPHTRHTQQPTPPDHPLPTTPSRIPLTSRSVTFRDRSVNPPLKFRPSVRQNKPLESVNVADKAATKSYSHPGDYFKPRAKHNGKENNSNGAGRDIFTNVNAITTTTKTATSTTKTITTTTTATTPTTKTTTFTAATTSTTYATLNVTTAPTTVSTTASNIGTSPYNTTSSVPVNRTPSEYNNTNTKFPLSLARPNCKELAESSISIHRANREVPYSRIAAAFHKESGSSTSINQSGGPGESVITRDVGDLRSRSNYLSRHYTLPRSRCNSHGTIAMTGTNITSPILPNTTTTTTTRSTTTTSHRSTSTTSSYNTTATTNATISNTTATTNNTTTSSAAFSPNTSTTLSHSHSHENQDGVHWRMRSVPVLHRRCTETRELLVPTGAGLTRTQHLQSSNQYPVDTPVNRSATIKATTHNSSSSTLTDIASRGIQISPPVCRPNRQLGQGSVGCSPAPMTTPSRVRNESRCSNVAEDWVSEATAYRDLPAGYTWSEEEEAGGDSSGDCGGDSVGDEDDGANSDVVYSMCLKPQSALLATTSSSSVTPLDTPQDTPPSVRHRCALDFYDQVQELRRHKDLEATSRVKLKPAEDGDEGTVYKDYPPFKSKLSPIANTLSPIPATHISPTPTLPHSCPTPSPPRTGRGASVDARTTEDALTAQPNTTTKAIISTPTDPSIAELSSKSLKLSTENNHNHRPQPGRGNSSTRSDSSDLPAKGDPSLADVKHKSGTLMHVSRAVERATEDSEPTNQDSDVSKSKLVKTPLRETRVGTIDVGCIEACVDGGGRQDQLPGVMGREGIRRVQRNLDIIYSGEKMPPFHGRDDDEVPRSEFLQSKQPKKYYATRCEDKQDTKSNVIMRGRYSSYDNRGGKMFSRTALRERRNSSGEYERDFGGDSAGDSTGDFTGDFTDDSEYHSHTRYPNSSSNNVSKINNINNNAGAGNVQRNLATSRMRKVDAMVGTSEITTVDEYTSTRGHAYVTPVKRDIATQYTRSTTGSSNVDASSPNMGAHVGGISGNSWVGSCEGRDDVVGYSKSTGESVAGNNTNQSTREMSQGYLGLNNYRLNVEDDVETIRGCRKSVTRSVALDDESFQARSCDYTTGPSTACHSFVRVEEENQHHSKSNTNSIRNESSCYAASHGKLFRDFGTQTFGQSNRGRGASGIRPKFKSEARARSTSQPRRITTPAKANTPRSKKFGRDTRKSRSSNRANLSVDAELSAINQSKNDIVVAVESWRNNIAEYNHRRVDESSQRTEPSTRGSTARHTYRGEDKPSHELSSVFTDFLLDNAELTKVDRRTRPTVVGMRKTASLSTARSTSSSSPCSGNYGEDNGDYGVRYGDYGVDESSISKEAGVDNRRDRHYSKSSRNKHAEESSRKSRPRSVGKYISTRDTTRTDMLKVMLHQVRQLRSSTMSHASASVKTNHAPSRRSSADTPTSSIKTELARDRAILTEQSTNSSLKQRERVFDTTDNITPSKHRTPLSGSSTSRVHRKSHRVTSTPRKRPRSSHKRSYSQSKYMPTASNTMPSKDHTPTRETRLVNDVIIRTSGDTVETQQPSYRTNDDHLFHRSSPPTTRPVTRVTSDPASRVGSRKETPKSDVSGKRDARKTPAPTSDARNARSSSSIRISPVLLNNHAIAGNPTRIHTNHDNNTRHFTRVSNTANLASDGGRVESKECYGGDTHSRGNHLGHHGNPEAGAGDGNVVDAGVSTPALKPDIVECAAFDRYTREPGNNFDHRPLYGVMRGGSDQNRASSGVRCTSIDAPTTTTSSPSSNRLAQSVDVIKCSCSSHLLPGRGSFDEQGYSNPNHVSSNIAVSRVPLASTVHPPPAPTPPSQPHTCTCPLIYSAYPTSAPPQPPLAQHDTAATTLECQHVALHRSDPCNTYYPPAFHSQRLVDYNGSGERPHRPLYDIVGSGGGSGGGYSDVGVDVRVANNGYKSMSNAHKSMNHAHKSMNHAHKSTNHALEQSRQARWENEFDWRRYKCSDHSRHTDHSDRRVVERRDRSMTYSLDRKLLDKATKYSEQMKTITRSLLLKA